MRPRLLLPLLLAAAPVTLSAQTISQPLPTGQRLTPLAAPGARFLPLVARIGLNPAYVADGASAIAVRPDGREMLVLTSGYNRYNGANGKLVPAQSTQYVFRFAIDRSGARWVQTLSVPNSFGGIAWLPGARGFLVGGGVDDKLYRFDRGADGFAAAGSVSLGHTAGLGIDVKPQAAGVAVSPDGRLALVADYYNDSVTLVDVASMRVVAERDLRPGKIDPARSGVAGGEFPFAVAWTGNGRAWVSSPRDRELVALAVGPAGLAVAGRVRTTGEPTSLLVDRAGDRLIATEDNDDRLAIVSLATAKLVAEPRLRLPPGIGQAWLGKGLNPNSLAILPDRRLLVTLGGINALAMLPSRGIASGQVTGLIPTGWYPSAVASSTDGARLFVANRKSPPGPNPRGCYPELAIYRGQPNACGAANQYIFQLEKAGLLELPAPSPAALLATTAQVARNLGVPSATDRAAATAKLAAMRGRIRHIVYIVKENRTFDQVLGDLGIGDGDPRLAFLGQPLSPNHHRLASDFVTLDHFFDSGEQSSTGWTWSTAARVTDMLEKTAPVNYADRGLAYESEESDRNISEQQTPAERRATSPQISADPDLLPGPALVTAPDADDDDKPGQGYLWDAALDAGLSVRNYGFSDASNYDPKTPGAVPPIREPFKEGRRIYTPGDRRLAPHSDPYFRGFDQKLADYWRVLEWGREYDRMEAAGTLPALTLLRLSHDHFGDFESALDGVNTVETEMADNDYAVGLVAERIARGKAAGSTVVFVVEDDAQNGADHVDARRAPALVFGAGVKQHALVSTRYTTVNLLRTMEVLLGLKPLGLNDALAMPMADVFDPAVGPWTYRAEAAAVLRGTQLPIPADRFAARTAAESPSRCPLRSAAWWAAAMKGQDFSKEDRLDTNAFNAALWRGLTCQH